MESLESEELLEPLSSKCCGNGGAFRATVGKHPSHLPPWKTWKVNAL